MPISAGDVMAWVARVAACGVTWAAGATAATAAVLTLWNVPARFYAAQQGTLFLSILTCFLDHLLEVHLRAVLSETRIRLIFQQT